MRSSSDTCAVCGKNTDRHEFITLSMISHPVDDLIRVAKPEIDTEAPICKRCRADFRRHYVESSLIKEKSELSSLETAVLDSLAKEDIVARNIDSMYREKFTFGQRLADRIASLGGSWSFSSTARYCRAGLRPSPCTQATMVRWSAYPRRVDQQHR